MESDGADLTSNAKRCLRPGANRRLRTDQTWSPGTLDFETLILGGSAANTDMTRWAMTRGVLWCVGLVVGAFGQMAIMLISAMLATAVLTTAASAQTPAPTVATAVPPASAASEIARDTLKRASPSVIQIKGFFGTNTAKAFHGTGFAVAPGGIFMTNYHVVSEHVQDPARYRLEYVTVDGKSGPVTVLAVDVRHDLAIVRASNHAATPLTLQAAPPVKGERAYSIGFPLDVGLTITEGVSNGRVDESFQSRIHYSGAVNGGMSGGPALNAAGDVIGVNVSGYMFQQLVSFLVPAEHALALRTKALANPADASELKKDILAQLRAHSAALLGALDGPLPTQVSAGYKLPDKLAPFMECNAAGDPTPDQPVRTTRINCAAKSGLYLQRDLQSGEFKYGHIVMTTDKIDAWRFAKRFSSATSVAGERGRLRHVGPLACKNQVVGLKGFDANLLVCTRGYRKLEGLYDFTVRVTSLNGSKHGFISHLDMFGLEFEPGMAFIKRYVDAMEWTP
jgi:serine protease Do